MFEIRRIPGILLAQATRSPGGEEFHPTGKARDLLQGSQCQVRVWGLCIEVQ